MLLDYISAHPYVQACFVFCLAVVLIWVMTLKKIEKSDERSIQREREKQMLLSVPARPKLPQD
jgi:ATP/ADP translocase